MHLQPKCIIFLILSTLLAFSFAEFLHDASLATWDERRGFTLERREGPGCRSLCSPKSCCQPQPPASSRRSIDGPILQPRTLFDIAPNTRDSNIVQRFDDNKVKLIFHDDISSSSSVWEPITETIPAIDVGLKALCGCTALIVVSANGVYGAHFFEDQAWGPTGDFQNLVVKFLKNSNPNSIFKGLRGQVRDTLSANGAQVSAYILTPQKELPDDDPNAPGFVPGVAEYADQVNQLVELLPQLIPQLQGYIEVSLYQALDGGTTDDGEDVNPAEANLLDTTSRGRVLFQYDPQNNGVKTMRLFFETDLKFSIDMGPSPP